jgi:uncharacterized iron-regulated protein
MTEPSERSALEEELHERVRLRRLNGDYPLGLEEQLEAEFRSILEVTHRGLQDFSHLHHLVTRIRERAGEIRLVGDAHSRIPGGSLVHRAFRRLLRRHAAATVEDMTRNLLLVEAALREIERHLDAQRRHDQRILNDVLGGLLDRLVTIDALTASVKELENRIISSAANAN